MRRKLPEYIEMFEEPDKQLMVTMQIEEHIVRLDSTEQGYDILSNLLKNIPFELLRYSADDTEINLSLKYYEEVV